MRHSFPAEFRSKWVPLNRNAHPRPPHRAIRPGRGIAASRHWSASCPPGPPAAGRQREKTSRPVPQNGSYRQRNSVSSMATAGPWRIPPGVHLFADPGQFVGRHTICLWRSWGRLEHLPQVHRRVPGHGERQLGLVPVGSFPGESRGRTYREWRSWRRPTTGCRAATDKSSKPGMTGGFPALRRPTAPIRAASRQPRTAGDPPPAAAAVRPHWAASRPWASSREIIISRRENAW